MEAKCTSKDVGLVRSRHVLKRRVEPSEVVGKLQRVNMFKKTMEQEMNERDAGSLDSEVAHGCWMFLGGS